MASRIMWFLVLLLGCACAAPSIQSVLNEKQASDPQDLDQDKDDLKTAASDSHVKRRFSNWGAGYPSGYSGYSVTGYGTLDDKYNYGAGGYSGYDAIGASGYGGSYPGYSGYGGNSGYAGYKGYSGGSYGLNSYGGNGGYGGYGGNGGLNSYYGYNNPSYQGAYNLGFGYYNKRPGYGNIYSNGVTPSLVTGYRGYSRR